MARLPIRTDPLDDAERSALEALPRFRGQAWRAESGFWHDSDTTAADVIRFERDEHGNEDVTVGPVIEHMLDRVRAAAVIWACADRRDAARYGPHVDQVRLPAETRVLVADDGDAGMLLWLRPSAEEGWR